jgi:hypothetical protein
MRRSSKTPAKDANQLAAEIVRQSTEETPPQTIFSLADYFSKIGHSGGLKGGKSRAKKLSAKRRKQIATKAAKSRWSKSKK